MRRLITTGCIVAALAVATMWPAAPAARAALSSSGLHLPGDLFGDAIAISGNTAVVGAWGADNQAGAAYVFVRANGRWHQQAELKDPARTGADYFGYQVAVSGNTALIGAEGVNNDTGAAFIYARSNGAWHLQARLADNADPQAAFGFAVALSGSTAVVEAHGAPNGGAVFVYARSGTRWHLQARLANPLGQSNKYVFGFSLAAQDGTVLLAAENLYTSVAHVFVYKWSGTSWHEQARLRDPHFVKDDNFGDALALCGATAAAGAWGVRKGAGAVYVYVRSGSAWHLQKTLPSPDGTAPDEFGNSVALSSASGVMRLVIGAPNGQHGDGDAYSYSRSGTTWHEKAKIANPGGRSVDAFGYAVGLSRRNAVIGAPGKDSNAGAVYDLKVP